jgi:hypothetical protein
LRRWVMLAVLVVSACAHQRPIDDPRDDTPLHARVALRCPPGNTKKPPGAVEAHRVKGDPMVPLSEDTMLRMHRRGYNKVTIHAELCIAPTGDVSCLDFGNGTRPREIAQTIVDAVQEWKYEPAKVNGENVTSCGELNFNYRIL